MGQNFEVKTDTFAQENQRRYKYYPKIENKNFDKLIIVIVIYQACRSVNTKISAPSVIAYHARLRPASMQ